MQYAPINLTIYVKIAVHTVHGYLRSSAARSHLQDVVNFLSEHHRALLINAGDVPVLVQLVQSRGDLLEPQQVDVKEARQPWPLHLYHNFSVIPQSGTVHLP